ncbi:MAG: hypothetical protein U1E27_07670 [Kiritimatiellia bacterium]|nr:hypothetical protein [Kiritimatiellia bacterium]
MKIQKWVYAGAVGCAVALMAGCDWNFGGSADSWSDRYNWVNFSGTYEGTSGDIVSAVTGHDIARFTITHEGETLTFVDNWGSVYTGKFSSMRTTGGTSRDTAEDVDVPVNNDTLLASYEVKGSNAAGYPVTMTGTFQATVLVAGTPPRYRLTGRTIVGTYIELGGKVGSISGAAL